MSEFRDRVGNEVKTAWMNAIYHGEIASRSARIDSWMRTSTAVLGVSSVGAMWIWQGAAGEIAWQTLTAMVGAATAASATLSVADRGKLHASLRCEWIELRYKFDSLARQAFGGRADVNELERAFDRLMEKKRDIAKQQPGSPNQRLLRKAQHRVRRALGDAERASGA